MTPGMGLSDDHRRDIELMLFGSAAISATRKQVFGCCSDDLLSSDFRQRFSELRSGLDDKALPGTCVTWLADRGVVLEPGDKILDAMIRALQHDRDRRMTANALLTLSHTAKLGDRKMMVEELKRMIKTLEP